MKLIIIILCCGIAVGADNKTGPKSLKPDFTCKEDGYYLIRKGGDFFCVECPDCPHGQELEEKCTMDRIYPHTIDIECIPCKKGFYKDVNDYSSCRPCGKCLDHFKVKTSCEGDRNTICSHDSCESGYELDSKLQRCIPDERSIEKEQQNLIKMEEKRGNCTWIECKDNEQIKLNNQCIIEQIIEQINIKLKPFFFMLGFLGSFCVAIFVLLLYLFCMLSKKYSTV